MFRKYLLIILLAVTGSGVFGQEYPPKSNTLVTDYTNTLSADNKAQLENKLVAFNDSTSTQIAVVIIKSVGSYDIAEYGAGLGRNWGIGQKGKNNGILILVAIEDHKVTIQTGYGAEGAVPDAITSQVINNQIKPAFKGGDYYGGLDAAITSLIQYMRGEYKADVQVQDQNEGNGGGGSIGLIIFIVVVIVILIFRNIGRGGGHIIGGRGGASPFWWFLAGSALGGRGGWGGGSSGGSDSSDSGGGSFGGFGGGDFGGGGSSGSW
ncbi:TPM domain-containing protein [Mucilaginibacter sp. AW1-3]